MGRSWRTVAGIPGETNSVNWCHGNTNQRLQGYEKYEIKTEIGEPYVAIVKD